MVTSEVIAAAERHIGKGNMVSSAQLCLDDAKQFYTAGREQYARARALKSLAYSVGIGHEDYLAAAASV